MDCLQCGREPTEIFHCCEVTTERVEGKIYYGVQGAIDHL
jgi:hypothetical protein